MPGQAQRIRYCVLTRLEIGGVNDIIRSLDPNAFVISHPLADVKGGVVKRGGLH